VINNAVKYTPPGKRIWVDLLISDGTALLVVEDEGIGIAPSELERVFDQFYRGSKTRDKFSGVGLGLYVSRFLARMHGGDLWAETRPQGGTVIKLSLPVLTDNLENPQEGEGMKCACSRD
jgi:signal transduction histidine kinase